MNLHRQIAVLVLGAVLAAPLQAAERDPFSGLEGLLTPQVLLGGLISENDVSLLFAHLRESMLATADGREPPAMSPALSQRIDAAGSELRVRGTLIGLVLSQVMERAVRDAVRDFAQQAPRSTD
jgi:hypothetical protein